MEINLCYGCMEQSRGFPCPNCGYDPEKQRSQEFALPTGTILFGKYLVGNVLGQGGFGITYIGWDISLERKVAIKEYYPTGQVSRASGTRNLIWYTSGSTQSVQQDGMRAFLKEAQKMAKVDGLPNVVRILDLFQENETAYIVMDYVAGKTLKKALEETGPIDWEQAKDIFVPAIKAMEQVHRAGLVHRDLSPDNLMLTPDGDVMILDLGAAKDLNINSGASSALVAKGGFSPLEQYGQRGGSGTWTDVYAMAATIYYALTGMLPPTAVDRITADNIRWDYPGLLSLPTPVLKSLKKAMAVLVNDRTKTMAELEQGLFAETLKRESKPRPKPESKTKAKPEPESDSKPLPKPEPKFDSSNAPKAEPDSKSVPKPDSNSHLKDIPKPKSKPCPQKSPKWTTYTVAAVLVLACGIGVWTLVIRPSNDYRVALALMNSGKYREAAEAFEALGQYWNSPEKAVESLYQNAQALMDSGKFVEAAEAFEALGDYQDSVEKAENARMGSHLSAAYRDAQVLMDSGKFVEAAEAFEALGDYRDSAEKAQKVLYLNAQSLIDDGKYFLAMRAFSDLSYMDSVDKAQEAKESYWRVLREETLSAGAFHTVGLCSDGTVIAKGANNFGQRNVNFGQCNVDGWTDIVAVSAGGYYTVGLRSDGTVVATGQNGYGQCNVRSWTDIMAVSAGYSHTVGLRSDGTVVATGSNDNDQCNVSGWVDIVEVSAGGNHTVGLRNDGTVMSTGRNTEGQCDVSGWTDIVAVSAGGNHTLGLRSDGTVVSTGSNASGQCNVSSWADIVAVSAAGAHTVGLRSNGTAVATGWDGYGQCSVGGSNWKDIIMVSAGDYQTVCLCKNGSAVSTGIFGVCTINDWENIRTH